MTKGWYCICGKEIDEGKLYCSPRCTYIAEKMKTPLGLRMNNIPRSIRLFGKQYDKMHKGDDKQ